MKYWLVKSEPESYSIDELVKDKVTYWNGVRNYQARNFLRDEIKEGDKVFFYHSNTEEPGIYGICQVVKEGYPDFTAFDPDDKHFDPKSCKDDPTWYMVDIKLLKKFNNHVSLQDIKQNPKLQKMKLVQRGSRLSVMPVQKGEYEEILKMATK